MRATWRRSESLPDQPSSQVIHNLTWFLRRADDKGIIRGLLKRRKLRLKQANIHEVSLSLLEPTFNQSGGDLKIHKEDLVSDTQMLTIHLFQG